MKYGRVGFAALILIAIAVLWLALRPPKADVLFVPPSETNSAPGRSVGLAPPMPQQAVPAQATRKKAVSQSLQLALLSSTDWRAFVLDAMKRPEEGGYFYANHALSYCGRNLPALKRLNEQNSRTEVAKTGTLDPNSVAQNDRLFANCAAFVPGEAEQLHRDIKARSEADAKDPLVVVQKDALEAIRKAGRDEVRAVAVRVFELDDPLVLSSRDLLYGLATADVEAREKTGLIFAGRLVTVAQEPEYTKALFALQLGSCRPDAPCALDEERRFACVATRNCSLDAEADMQARLKAIGGTEADVKQVLDMAARVRQAVAERNVSFFVR